jgi:hypothetical protein
MYSVFVAPMCSPVDRHWTLVWIVVTTRSWKVSIYDSLKNTGGKKTAARRLGAVKAIVARLRSDNPGLPPPPQRLLVVYPPTPQQRGNYECGFATVANAIRLWNGQGLMRLGGKEDAALRVHMARRMISWGEDPANHYVSLRKPQVE